MIRVGIEETGGIFKSAKVKKSDALQPEHWMTLETPHQLRTEVRVNEEREFSGSSELFKVHRSAGHGRYRTIQPAIVIWNASAGTGEIFATGYIEKIP